MSYAATAEDTRAAVSIRQRPDLAWIKKNVPIEDVARRLGLDVWHHRARCWRQDNHRHGDADPSVRFQVRKNRVRCFVCDQFGGMSNIDLVMAVLDLDFPSAVRWICERFPVPTARRGSPIGPRSSWRPHYRVGMTGSELEMLVRCGVWAQLTPTQQKIIPVLLAFRDVENQFTEVSYRGLMRYAGVGSPKSVSRAVWGLHAMKALRVETSPGAGVVRGCNRYRLTLEDPEFLDLINSAHRRQSEEIRRERGFRTAARAVRARLFQSL